MKERYQLRINHAPTRAALEKLAKKEYTSLNTIITKACMYYLKLKKEK